VTASLAAVTRFELAKLLSQWRIRLLLAVCLVGPGVLVAVISHQSSLPSDTVFGRWMGTTGWAGSLVVLGFCCSWVVPLLTCLVPGDVFAVEDRLGTWRHLLVTVRSTHRVFAAKALASLTITVALLGGLMVSSLVGGLLSVGNRSLVGLDGHLLTPHDAAVAVLLSWAVVVAPTLAYAGVGLLGSVALGRSSTGLLVPALLALLLQVAQLLPLPLAVRVSLPSYALLAWRGLLTSPVQTAPVVAGVVVSLAWAVAAAALAYLLFQRRDFSDQSYDGLGRSALARAVLPMAALLAVSVGAVAEAAPPSRSGSGIDRPRLERALATSFGHLYRLQARELGRPDVTEQQLQSTATCDKGGFLTEDTGPGNDWRCVVSWHIPGATATGSAIYQLDVTSDGRYVADGDGPQSVNGFFQVRVPTGVAPNPLWQLDGSLDLLGSR
jgi:ABC-2 type transport system permease protein